jgi:serine/threonine protein kinase
VIYCINPYCVGRENSDDARLCASCGTPLLVLERLSLVRKICADEDLEVFEAIDGQKTYSGEAGSHKILKVLKSVDPDRVKAFATETLILQSLQHRAIPKVDALYDSFELDETVINRRLPCLVMSMFEGVTLEEYVLSHGPISQRIAIDYLLQLASILNYIHTERINDEGGVIHRDIKPGNIIVQPSGELALIDFGFGLIMSSTYQSRLGTGIGETSKVETIYYTPPEQIARRPIPQSDFFALGMTVIFAVTGKQLYEMEMRSWQPQWQKYVKHLDKPFIQFLEQLTNPAAYKRPASAEEILSVVSDTLPAKLKWRARLRSTPYRIVIGAIATLVGVGLFQLGRIGLAQYYYSRGDEFTKVNNFEEARFQYEQSLKILPNADTFNNLGLACSQLGDLDCALSNYQQTIKLNPKGWEGYYQLAGYYEDLEKPDYIQAEKYYRKAISLSQPIVLEPRNNLARVLILRGRYTEAESILETALPIAKETQFYAQILKNLGWLYFEKKQFDKAEKYLLQSSEIDANLVTPHCLLAKINIIQKKTSSKPIELCLTLTGDDLLNTEVLRWRQEFINKLLRNKSSIQSSVFPS